MAESVRLSDLVHEWRRFRMGERVRVRLSGECRTEVVYVCMRCEDDCDHDTERRGHDPAEDGAVGRIDSVPNDQPFDPESILGRAILRDPGFWAHEYAVEFDAPVHPAGADPQMCIHYAANELEPLD